MKKLNILKNKDGIAIMSVLLMFSVMSLMIGSISIVTMQNANQADVNEENLSAFYAAEAGLNMVIEEYKNAYEKNHKSHVQVRDDLVAIHDKYHQQTIELSNIDGHLVQVTIEFELYQLDEFNKKLNTRIAARGESGSFRRTLESNVEMTHSTGTITSDMKLRHAVLVKNTITTGNATITTYNKQDAKIIPRIATLSTAIGSVNINGLKFPNGQIELSSKADELVVTPTASRGLITDTKLLTEDRPLETNEIRAVFPTINFQPIRDKVADIISSKNYTEAKNTSELLSSSTLKNGTFFISHLDFSKLGKVTNINVPTGHDVFIITDKITLDSIDITGDGKVTIFVNNGSGSFVPNSNGTEFGRVDQEEKLEIYVDTISGVQNNNFHVTFRNNSLTRGYFMFENARVRFNQNSTLKGAIYTGAVNGSVEAVKLLQNANISEDEGRALIVAPNGKVRMEKYGKQF